MHTDIDHLKRIAEEIASNTNGNYNSGTAAQHLVNEADHLEKAIRYDLMAFDNFTQRDSFHFDTLIRLVDICDVLFDIDQTISPNVKVLLKLLAAVRQIIPAEIRPNLRLPKAFVLQQKELTMQWWTAYLPLLAEQEIDLWLVEIAGIPFKEFSEPKHKLYWGNYTWLKAYEIKLEAMDWQKADCNSKTEALVSLLIASGFNDDRFFVYCKNIIQQRTGRKTGRGDKLKELANCRKLVLQDSRHKASSYKPKIDPLVTQLLVWITAEEEYINVHEPEQSFAKLGFQLYQYTLAFFFKLLHEQKVFGDISFRELSKQVASTCTAMGAEIPPDAMVKKAYLKKEIDFKRMESLLLAMLEYLRRFM